MKKLLSIILALSLAFHFPNVSGNELNEDAYDRHSLLPISQVNTLWFIANTQTGTMAYTYPCKSNCSSYECLDVNLMPCADSRIVSLMPDINVVVYLNGSSSYWVDTKTGCHFILPSNKPKNGQNENSICFDESRI